MTSRDLLVEAALTAHDNSTVLFELQEDDCTDKQLADLMARITEMQSNISTLAADLNDARRDLALAVAELQEARRAIVSLVELMRREKES
jgi:hypothetical protein